MDTTLELIHLHPAQSESINYDFLALKVRVPARLDIVKSHELWILFSTITNAGAKKIMVDMSSMESIDSSGIGILINTAKRLRAGKGDIVLTGVSADIKKIFKVVNLQDFIKIFSLEAEALNFFRYL